MAIQLNVLLYDKGKLASILDDVLPLTYPRLRSLLARAINRRRFIAYALDDKSTPSGDRASLEEYVEPKVSELSVLVLDLLPLLILLNNEFMSNLFVQECEMIKFGDGSE